MKKLYAVKSFGRTRFFATEELRTEWLATMPEGEQNHAELWEVIVG